jgi:predicted metal-binding membrane protein
MSTAFQDKTGMERLIQEDRLILSGAIALIAILAWAYLARMAHGMDVASNEAEMHAAMGMVNTTAWSLSDAFALFLMWSVMMAGMMLPSAAPVILMVLGVYRRRGGEHARVSAATFTAGYFMAWIGFSAAATVLQTGLHAAALLSLDMVSQSALLAGGIFLVAGIYQWLPIKDACLSHCRSPLHFLSQEWREGTRGAFRMGLRHGIFCVGCCWALMILLFAAGVMNLFWVAAIAIFVLVEKLLPQPLLVGRAAGVLLASWGVYLLAFNK